MSVTAASHFAHVNVVSTLLTETLLETLVVYSDLVWPWVWLLTQEYSCLEVTSNES